MSAPGRRTNDFALRRNRGRRNVLFSICDIELLRLLRWCRFMNQADLRESFEDTTIQNLMSLNLIRLHDTSGFLMLSGQGSRLLDKYFQDMPTYGRLSYSKADIQRRIRMSKLTLTAYRAHLSIFQTDLFSLSKPNTYFLPGLTRGRGANPWSNSRIAALLRLENTLFAAHYVSPGIGNLLFTDELNAFSNNTSQIPKVHRALIFAGESYQSILEELERTGEDEEGRSISYGAAFRVSPTPIHLLPCQEVGALQLRIMAVPGYRQRLTRAALRGTFSPAPMEYPCWDALFDGQPFVLAVDMDLRRVDAALTAAKMQGIKKIAIAALREQVKEVLNQRYKVPGLARVFTLTEDAISSLGDMSLYTPSPEGYHTEEGGVIHAPPIKAAGKTGRPAGKQVRQLGRAQ